MANATLSIDFKVNDFATLTVTFILKIANFGLAAGGICVSQTHLCFIYFIFFVNGNKSNMALDRDTKNLYTMYLGFLNSSFDLELWPTFEKH